MVRTLSLPAPAAALVLALAAVLAPRGAAATPPSDTAATPPSGAAAGPPSDGTIEADGARVEILGKPVRVGETIELPEGFIRVEEAGQEDEHVGSFSVVPAASMRATADARAAAPAAGAATSASAPAATSQGIAPMGLAVAGSAPEPACARERNAYLRELWKQSGIDVTDVDAIIQGLEGTGYGPATGFFWFAAATDPFRPLAWSSDLRDRADALARCVREHAGTKMAASAR